MKISLKWLKEYVDVILPPEKLAEKITAAGTEVSHIDVIGGWENVFVGRIAAINPHPNADRLRLATIELGAEQETVVCGAPNLVAGDKIAFARVGAKLLDGHSGEPVVLKPVVIRGVASRGMVCSEKELGLSQAHEGILVLPPDAPLGMLLREYLGDVILDLEVTPNRPDMLSVLGVAHETGALTGQAVREPVLDYTAAAQSMENNLTVEIKDAVLCPRYSASLIEGVKVGPSPGWLKERLVASGVRSISNVVDITNYVMLEFGQPLHAFDFKRIIGPQIIIRPAGEGETMTTLDGMARTLTADTLVIADAMRPVAIAGVMGGATSEVNDATTTILLESASFKPASIHHTGDRLALHSEASTRFERGISPLLTLPALIRGTQLIVELCNGTPAGIVDHFPGAKVAAPIPITPGEVKRLLGAEYSHDDIKKTLLLLGCRVERGSSENEMLVDPPYWRSDLKITADIVEEVARINGYDRIPFSRLPSPLPEYMPAPMFQLKKSVRQVLAGFGFNELITYAYTSRAVLEKGLNAPLDPEPLKLANPMAADQECLRTSLRGSLLSALAANLRHTRGLIAIFELGRIYLRRANELPFQPEMLCGLMTSNGAGKIWHGRQGPADFYDTKGAVTDLLARLGLPADFHPGNDPGLRPGCQAAVLVREQVAGVVGELHPQVAGAFELPPGTFLFELNLEVILPLATGFGGYTPLARYPAVERDLALLVDAAVTHQQIVAIIQDFRLVKQVILFDVYSGKQVPFGKKSLAYSLIFQSTEHTLTEAEVTGVLQSILKKLGGELGAVLRG